MNKDEYKGNELEEVCKQITENANYSEDDITKLNDILDKTINEEESHKVRKFEKFKSQLSKYHFSGPETNPKVFIKDLVDAILRL